MALMRIDSVFNARWTPTRTAPADRPVALLPALLVLLGVATAGLTLLAAGLGLAPRGGASRP